MKKQKSFEPMVFEVESESEDKKYLVAHYRPDRWRCTCPDFVYRSRDERGYSKYPPHRCKHIKKIIEKLERDMNE